jgi:hypothetical protein
VIPGLLAWTVGDPSSAGKPHSGHFSKHVTLTPGRWTQDQSRALSPSLTPMCECVYSSKSDLLSAGQQKSERTRQVKYE